MYCGIYTAKSYDEDIDREYGCQGLTIKSTWRPARPPSRSFLSEASTVPVDWTKTVADGLMV